jgi:predicted GIY-YIG superfamily endonuclease
MYVYKLRSESDPAQIYTGLTRNVKERLNAHNAGQSPHTSKFTPWRLEFFVWFGDSGKAAAFERYLKSGSGRAFSSKHF